MRTTVRTILISIVIGLSFGSYLYFTYDHRPVRIYTSLLSALCIGCLMMLVITKRQYITAFISSRRTKAVLISLLLIVAALLGTELTFLLRGLTFAPPYQPFSAGSIYILNILIVLVAGFPIYISEEWKEIQQAQSRQQLAQQQLTFELELLKAKVNPHFLYNMHNTIAGLIPRDPAKAEELVLLLSKFFRFSLDKHSAGFHRVSDELEIIQTYLHMQQIRFSSKMSYQINASPDILHLLLPGFILQPLVENAVKYGIEASAASGCINIQLSLTAAQLHITIGDTGPGFPDYPGSGHGLQLVLQKLQLLYGENFSLTFHSSPEKYVRLVIPKRDPHLTGG